MNRVIGKRIGCLVALSVPLCLILAFVGSFGLTRTSQPSAAQVETEAFTLQMETAAEPEESRGPWPVTYRTVYPDQARIRGTLTPRSRDLPIDKLALIIATPAGARHDERCDAAYRDACYFGTDLRPATLTQGLVVTVIDLRSGKPVAPPSRFSFHRTTGYSSVYWDSLMGI